MEDLFTSNNKMETVKLPGGDVSYLGSFDVGMPPDQMLLGLIEETPWRQENVIVWGKTFKQPRLVAWYGNAGHAYSYSGVRLQPLPWTERISLIKAKLENFVQVEFNSVLLNYYRDQNDSMGMHSDDEKELGPRPTIASISFGAKRTFVFKNKLYPAAKLTKISLESGSLLLMKGETQKNYKHGISKEKRAVGPRVNLTFRIIVS